MIRLRRILWLDSVVLTRVGAGPRLSLLAASHLAKTQGDILNQPMCFPASSPRRPRGAAAGDGPDRSGEAGCGFRNCPMGAPGTPAISRGAGSHTAARIAPRCRPA